VKRGEVWSVDFGPPSGPEQAVSGLTRATKYETVPEAILRRYHIPILCLFVALCLL
jgi:hypothetical protein